VRSIHVPLPSGLSHAVQLYDVVNVGTHPQLREPALSGTLHRLDGGEVALPFVYHDPHARKLALVVPESRRHEELALRAERMAELARDTEHAVPAYVRELTSVIGVAGLAAYLDRASSSAALEEVARQEAAVGQREGALQQREAAVAQRESALQQREAAVTGREAAVAQRESAIEQRTRELEAHVEALGQRENRLLARAEQVTRREDELRSLSEEIEASQADLAVREQELESRFESLRQREAELADRAESSLASRGTEIVRLVDDEVEELDELEPIATSPGELRPELQGAVQLIEEPSRTLPPAALADVDLRPRLGGMADVAIAELVDDDVEEEAYEEVPPDVLAEPASGELRADEVVDDEDEDDEVEELDDVEPIGDVTGIHAGLPVRPERRPSEAPAPIALPASEPPPPPKPSVAPPPGFLGRQGPAVRAVSEAGSVRVFVRLPEGKDDVLDESADLLVQLAVIEEQPVVLLTLVADSSERPTILRAALDPRGPDDRQVLEALRRRFAARIVAFSSGGRYLRSFDVNAPREVNVARIVERVARMRTAAAVDTATAIERVLSAPPPTRAKDHPFVDEELASAATAGDAAKRLDHLAEWSSHDKLDHALLVLSIPHDRVDGTLRRVLTDAVEHGLALDRGLAERAVSLGVAPDRPTLIARQIEALARTSQLPQRGGLSAERLADEWERTLKAAAESEVAIDTQTHELAWKRIREVRGGVEGPVVELSKLPEMGVPELVMLLEHPSHRKDAALELCRRKDVALAETVCKSVRKMPRAEVVRIVPRVTDLGEEAGDALIDGLGARKTFVRQAFALALAHLKLRRAVVPLVHLLASEDSDVWREVARVVGTFGNASLRNVTRQAREPKGREERYVWTLAHLANHGCAKQVEKLTTEEVPAVAAMAVEALTLRERARLMENQVHGSAPTPADDAILQFSRRFYQELEGAAPTDDLPDVTGSET
jgi:hypothetical protein